MCAHANKYYWLYHSQSKACINSYHLYPPHPQLEDGHSLFDYDVGLNDIVQIIVKTPLPEEMAASTSTASSEQNSEEHMDTVSVSTVTAHLRVIHSHYRTAVWVGASVRRNALGRDCIRFVSLCAGDGECECDLV